MTPSEAINLFIGLIASEASHRHYDKTVEAAKFAHQVVTGEGMDDLITSVRRREDEELKEQRIRITKPLTPVASSLVMKNYRKMRRIQYVKIDNRWAEGQDSEDKRKKITQSEQRFYAGQSLSEYCFDMAEYYTFLDANTFLVYERENSYDAEGRLVAVKTYPMIVESDKVRYYDTKFGDLSVLLTEDATIEVVGKKELSISEYRLYINGFVIHIKEYVEGPSGLVAQVAGQNIPYNTLEVEVGKSFRRFEYFAFPNGTGEVPAIRLSAYLDRSSRGEIGATPLHPVKNLLEQMINIGSLHDLTIFLHSIPRRREVVQACDYQDEHVGGICKGGFMSGAGYDGDRNYTCPKCKGSGEKSITSEQDSIRIVVPPHTPPDQIPDLSKFAHVEEPNIELLEFQQRKLDWLFQLIIYAVFTREQVSMSDVISLSQTATERRLNEQDIYDQMLPYAQLISQMYMLGMRCIAYYNDISEGFVSSHQFPDDYQFETENDLIKKLENLRAANAPYYLIERANMQLVRRQTNSAEEAERVKAWDKWRPFRGLTDEAIMVVLSERIPEDYDRMLYENYGTVQREVEEKTGGLFYTLDYDKQKELIAKEIDTLRGSIAFRTEEIPQMTFDA